MKKIVLISFISFVAVSCNDKVQDQNVTEETIQEEQKEEREDVPPHLENTTPYIIDNLQGIWKATDGLSTMEFKGDKVKYVLESEKEAEFLEYEISSLCDTKAPVYEDDDIFFKQKRYGSCLMTRFPDQGTMEFIHGAGSPAVFKKQ